MLSGNFNVTKLCCSANAVMTEMDKFGQAIITKIEFTVKLPQTNCSCVVELYGAEAFMDKFSPLYVVNWQSFATALKSNALVRQVSLALVSQAKKRAAHGADSAAVTVGIEDSIVCSNTPVSTVSSADKIVPTNINVFSLISSHTVIPSQGQTGRNLYTCVKWTRSVHFEYRKRFHTVYAKRTPVLNASILLNRVTLLNRNFTLQSLRCQLC